MTENKGKLIFLFKYFKNIETIVSNRGFLKTVKPHLSDQNAVFKKLQFLKLKPQF